MLEPVVPPGVVAVNPPPGSVDRAAAGVHRRDLRPGHVRRARQRLLVGDRPGQLHPRRPGDRRRHDPVGPLRPDHPDGPAHRLGPGRRPVHADRRRLDRRAPTAWRWLAPYVTQFTAVSDLSQYVKLTFTTTRSDRNTGTVSYDVTIENTSQFNLLVPIFLILDPAQGFTGTPAGGYGERQRELADQPEQHGARRRPAGAGPEHDRPDAHDRRPRRPGDRVHGRRSPARPPRSAPRSSTASR